MPLAPQHAVVVGDITRHEVLGHVLERALCIALDGLRSPACNCSSSSVQGTRTVYHSTCSRSRRLLSGCKVLPPLIEAETAARHLSWTSAAVLRGAAAEVLYDAAFVLVSVALQTHRAMPDSLTGHSAASLQEGGGIMLRAVTIAEQAQAGACSFIGLARAS